MYVLTEVIFTDGSIEQMGTGTVEGVGKVIAGRSIFTGGIPAVIYIL